MWGDSRLALVSLCFLLSGFAALIYQTAWTRQFAFVFGTSELAVATVLAGYMGGLAAGAAVAAKWSSRVTRPVRVYGLLELGIAFSALIVVPAGITASTWLVAVILGREGPLSAAGGASQALFYAVCSFLIVLLPTALMGATLPLLARHAVRRDHEIGQRVGSLYAVNTLGAVAGAVCAGFVLLPALGLARTVWIAAACNAAIFVAAAGLSRSPESNTRPADLSPSPARVGQGRWILPLIAASGVVSFSYEILWTRILGHVLGGSIYAFSTMLAAFLTGIAAGSWLASRFASSAQAAATGFAWVQLGIAALSVTAFFAVDWVPMMARELGSEGGARVAVDAAIGALTLLPAALCIGATFPLAVRILCRGASDAGPTSARVYAWNTGGAIVGALGAGFFVLPALGFAGTLGAAACANLVLAFIASTLATPRGAANNSAATRSNLANNSAATRSNLANNSATAIAVVSLAALFLFPPSPPWELLRSSALNLDPIQGSVRHYAVGRSAVVLMVERLGLWQLRTNGLPEAAIEPPGRRPSAFGEARWMAALPSLARSEARRLLVIGLGGGVVAEHVPTAIERIDIVELEPEVVEANRSVGAERAVDPLADPRVHIVLNDARAALARTSDRYDGIVSQPSHPWTAGASHLYTREFFALTRDHLTPSGVLVQWMGARFVDDALLRSLVATLSDVFAEVELFQPNAAGLLLVASAEPIDLPGPGPGLADLLGFYAPEDLLAVRLLDTRGARVYSAGAPLITDDQNWLLMRSPGIARGSPPPISAAESLGRFDALSNRSADEDLYVFRRLLARGLTHRARAWSETWPEGALRLTASALLEPSDARGTDGLERALVLDPLNRIARLTLLRRLRIPWRLGDERALEAARDVSPELRLVLDAWAAEDAEDWRAVKRLDASLAAIHPTGPEFTEALRIRVRWRLAVADEAPAEADTTLELANRLVSLEPVVGHTFLRTQAVAAAGHHRGAVASMFELVSRLRPRVSEHESIARRCRELLASLPNPPPGSELELDHRRLDNRLNKLLPQKKRRLAS